MGCGKTKRKVLKIRMKPNTIIHRAGDIKARPDRLMARLVLAALILLVLTGAANASGLVTISPKQAKDLIQQETGNPDFVLLDIRTPPEFKAGHIEGAILIDYYGRDFLKKMQALDKDKIYLMYCRSANRSTRTLALVKDMGFKSLYNMDQGINGWIKNGFPVVK